MEQVKRLMEWMDIMKCGIMVLTGKEDISIFHVISYDEKFIGGQKYL